MERRIFIGACAAGAASLFFPWGKAAAKPSPTWYPTGVLVWFPENGQVHPAGWSEKEWEALKEGDLFQVTHPHYDKYTQSCKEYADSEWHKVWISKKDATRDDKGMWSTWVDEVSEAEMPMTHRIQRPGQLRLRTPG